MVWKQDVTTEMTVFGVEWLFCWVMLSTSPCCCDWISSCCLSHQPEQQHLCECLQVDLSASSCWFLTVSPRSLGRWCHVVVKVTGTLVSNFNLLLLGAFAVTIKPVPNRNHSVCKGMRWWLMQLCGRRHQQLFIKWTPADLKSTSCAHK